MSLISDPQHTFKSFVLVDEKGKAPVTDITSLTLHSRSIAELLPNLTSRQLYSESIRLKHERPASDPFVIPGISLYRLAKEGSKQDVRAVEGDV